MLKDNYNRIFSYIRLSIIDRCNFKCGYCLPNGYKKLHNSSFLNLDELSNLLFTLSQLKIEKIRLTGGEPSLRRDLIDIIALINSFKNIKTIAITTNGYKLPSIIDDMVRNGLTNLNVSIDSLNSNNFFNITKQDKLKVILQGIDRALELGIIIKINVVLLKGINSNEIDDFLAFVKNKKLTVRFIELMRTNDNVDYFQKYYISPLTIRDKLYKEGWSIKAQNSTAGPAIEFIHNDYIGSIGFIAPYMGGFCSSCNRLRISALGKLHLCLFGDDSFDLRPLLQNISQREELQNVIMKLLTSKERGHKLLDDYSGKTDNLAKIGG